MRAKGSGVGGAACAAALACAVAAVWIVWRVVAPRPEFADEAVALLAAGVLLLGVASLARKLLLRHKTEAAALDPALHHTAA